MSSAVQVARLTLPSELNSDERFVNTSGGELGQGNICMLGGLVSRCRRNRQIISAIGSASGRMVVRSTPWVELPYLFYKQQPERMNRKVSNAGLTTMND